MEGKKKGGRLVRETLGNKLPRTINVTYSLTFLRKTLEKGQKQAIIAHSIQWR